MSSSFSAIKQSALSLPLEEREQLANELFDSLTVNAQNEIELAWIKEAELRHNDILSGKAQTISGEEVSSRIKEMLGWWSIFITQKRLVNIKKPYRITRTYLPMLQNGLLLM